jgi:hypothetical protein
MGILPKSGKLTSDGCAVFSKSLSQSMLASVRSSTLALSPSFSLPLSAQSAAHRCEEQREELVGVMLRALARGAPGSMKLVYQARDKQNEGGEVVGEERKRQRPRGR